jgi:hypothetical protein
MMAPNGLSKMPISRYETKGSESMTSFIEKSKQQRAHMEALNADAWLIRLEGVHGKIGDDGVERIGTHELLDILEVPQRCRGVGTTRRIARLMRELGWSAIRMRRLTRGGFLDQVRGYARDARDRRGSRPTPRSWRLQQVALRPRPDLKGLAPFRCHHRVDET